MVKFSDLLFGKPAKLREHQNYNPQQNQYMDMILQQLGGPTGQGMNWLSSLFGDENFSEYEQPFINQFEQQTIPSIMERFAGAGAKSSSGLNQSLAQAGTQLSTNLAGQRAGLRGQALGQLGQFANMGLNQRSTSYQTSGTQGLVQQVLPMLLKMMGMPGI